MAVHLSKINNRVKILIALFVAFSAKGSAVLGQNLVDPTRPPAIAESGAEQGAASGASGPELQSVLISPTRRVAIISGQSVTLGERFGEARVVKITENEVVLQNGKELQVLKLFPGVQKNIKPGRAGSGANSRNK